MSQTRPCIVITGASSGIGREFAMTAPGDALLLLVARSEERLAVVAAQVEATGRDVVTLALDVTVVDATASLLEKLALEGLHCDVLVNNAGSGIVGRAIHIDGAAHDSVARVNFNAPAALALAVLPGMMQRGRGGVINVASVAAFMPGPGMATYYAAKAALHRWSESLWEECRGAGVTVTSVCPGPVETDFLRRATGKNGPRGPFHVSAQHVALEAWQGFARGRRKIVPGFLNRAAVVAFAVMPRRAALAIVKRYQLGRSGIGLGKTA